MGNIPLRARVYQLNVNLIFSYWSQAKVNYHPAITVITCSKNGYHQQMLLYFGITILSHCLIKFFVVLNGAYPIHTLLDPRSN